ncbi:MAG: hypothetical protein E6468_08985 [Varibaculum cambriense]|uniref:AAA family ATPase n=1 Tax=Varibaculum cambriense TaxID=184870 RepID=UPI00290FAC35|nr:hypothetical protein [Varibaculum cambriense]MDU6681958.1 hypothetical protein [Varibaculum cambriense]
MSEVLASSQDNWELELQKWFSERPKWLQIAANWLYTRSSLSSEDISKLTTFCKQEANGNFFKTPASFSTAAFCQAKTSTVRLHSIKDVEGVNALHPKKELEFGDSNIAIVYGNNGSGKSGYVRLLKHICGARESGTLYNNVYKSGIGTQKACISYKHDHSLKTYTWTGEGICEDLSSIDIFDTSFGKIFANSEDEVSYEPPVLSFFSSLISVCEQVDSALEDESNKNQSKKPDISNDMKVTDEGHWYETVSTKTTTQDINSYCSFNGDDETKIQRLQQRLSQHFPEKKAKELRTQKQHIDALVQDAKNYRQQLSDENCRGIIASKKKSIDLRTAADAAANKVFSDSELEGIGSEIWRELWEAARKYSESVAYKEIKYPNVSEDSRCVLCQQILTPESKDMLISFENFVKGQMQKAATDAVKQYETAIQSIEEIPTSEMLKTRIDAAGFSQEEVSCQVTDFFSQLQNRKNLLPEIKSEEDIPAYSLPQEWIAKAEDYSKRLEIQAKECEADAESDNRKNLKKELDSLQARKWLSKHRSFIEEEIKYLHRKSELHKAKKLTSTKALSKKKGELAGVLITDAFAQRFNDELAALGASRIKVELVKTRVSKGRVLHKLKLRNASQSLSEVLSEGENRIVSIAAFLADVMGNESKAPFIFDDPISSLDQTYEETVVHRLIELSQDRQIIIFTHRLSLLGTFKHFAEKKSLKLVLRCIRSADWGTGEPANIPLSQGDIKTSLNKLIDERYQEAKRARENGELDEEENLKKSICSDFRILIERSIENDLLCGVVQRFQRPIHTLKVKELAKLNGKDISFLDSLMTKYSGYEHSQPLESPVNLPPLENLQRDMKSLKTWREEYTKRKTTAKISE